LRIPKNDHATATTERFKDWSLLTRQPPFLYRLVKPQQGQQVF
jgi:hypothetical protein